MQHTGMIVLLVIILLFLCVALPLLSEHNPSLPMSDTSLIVRTTNSVRTWSGRISYTEDWDYTIVRPGAHTFWWLYAGKKSIKTRPLVLWLQGGPGQSSTGMGNFLEIGPKFFRGNDRASTWLQLADLVFVDNPVGTGFSYVDNATLLTTDLQQVGKDLLTWLKAFLERHPEYRTRPFYIVGESYGGKWTVELAKNLYEAIRAGTVCMTQFKGIGLGDSAISILDSLNVMGDYMKKMKIFSDELITEINRRATECQSHAENNNWFMTTVCMAYLFQTFGQKTNISTNNIFKNATEYSWPELGDYMNKEIKETLIIIPDNIQHAAEINDVVSSKHVAEMMRPVYSNVDTLLSYDLQVTVYNGNLDLLITTPGVKRWIDKLQWSGLRDFNNSKKKPFKTSQFNPAGFIQSHDNLQFVQVLNSGHMVPYDDHESALFILKLMLGRN